MKSKCPLLFQKRDTLTLKTQTLIFFKVVTENKPLKFCEVILITIS